MTTTTIRVDKDQSDRAKKLKDKYNIKVKEQFEKGLIFYEKEKEGEYNSLLKEKEKIEYKLISQKAKIEHKRRELRIVADNYHDTLNDVLNIWKESKKELNIFCQDNLQYLAKIMGKYKEISTLEEFKEILKEKRNF
jgi:hypothetical protein